MAAEYLEIAKTSERDTRSLVQRCHNFKNIVLVKKSFDDKTELWHTKNSFVPVNYIELILEYTKQNDFFQLTKTPEKSFRHESPYAHPYYGCIAPIQTKKQDLKKLAKRTKKLFAEYDHDCIEIWESQLGQLEVEQISNFFGISSCQVKKQDPRKKASRCSPIFLMTSTLMKHHHWINVMPRQEGDQVISTLKHTKKTFLKLIVEIKVCICCCSLLHYFVIVS